MKIFLITSDLSPGGAERVLATLANNIVLSPNIEVHLVCLVQGKMFYQIDPRVRIHFPKFNYKNYPKIVSFLKTFLYLRQLLVLHKPNSYLSFGGRYNALSILSGIGLMSRVYVSDRSRPGISYGKIFDFLNKLLYPHAYGIVAQTEKAKEFHLTKLKHKNIKVIGNPVPFLYDSRQKRKNVILNVGRFISSKNQMFLIDVFQEMNLQDWELWFVGSGRMLQNCKERVQQLNLNDRIRFLENIKDVKSLYNQCKVFAFTSTSEGFPNALGEAMSAGLACVSFDCTAGPSDLIEDSTNGFLVENLDKEKFKLRLQKLITDSSLIEEFGKKAKLKMIEFNEEKITQEYLDFLTK